MPGAAGRGIVALYKDGPQFEVRAVDSEGRRRPEWADAFGRGLAGAARMKSVDSAEYDWRELATRLAPHFGDRPLHAIAAIVVRNR